MTEIGPAQLAEQIAYYRARAPEYDDAYERINLHDGGEERNAQFRAAIDECKQALDSLELTGDVVELAAGTGFWTAQLAARARSVHAIDASPETLDVNRARCAGFTNVTYGIADVFSWIPTRTWDACVFCFWISHVPDRLLTSFLRTAAVATCPGGKVFFVDDLPDSEPEDPTELNLRRLNDGRTFTIVKHRRDPSQLRDACAAAGMEVEIHPTGRLFYAIGVRASSVKC